MKSALFVPALLACTATAAAQTVSSSGYAVADACRGCHAAIYDGWKKTGMGRSFFRPEPARMIEPFSGKNTYYHRASGTYFRMIQRDGAWYQRRWQIGFKGQETNADEQRIDYVLGSGAHARTYLARMPSGALLQLPLAWYAENGGYWAMNPGYDKADQPNARRKITYECMFCHNAYPQIVARHEQPRAEPLYSGDLPEGIDCQRCHGPGAKHIETARRGAAVEEIRASIVNPARLTPERQSEVCLQCHLETTSFPFTHSIVKDDRGPFSYMPGEALADFILYFDEAPGARTGRRNGIQIVSSAYRLRMSQCFLKSAGALQCVTCHDPHKPDDRPAHYNAVCRQCHSVTHAGAGDCIDCHMPKRRTEDVVRAVITDHYIQRRKPAGNLLATIPERNGPEVEYHGPEIPYMSPANALYLGVAQVHSGNNLRPGIAQLSDAVARQQPDRPLFYTELGDALRIADRANDAVAAYERGLRLKPDSLAALVGLGEAYDASNDPLAALNAFSRASKAAPDDPTAWLRLGQSLLKAGRGAEARTALDRSIALDPTQPDGHYALALLVIESEPDRAEAALREAIRLQPDYAQAQLNLAILLARRNRADEAAWRFEAALRLRPAYPLAHLNYALLLKSQNRRNEALGHLRQAAEGSDPAVANAAKQIVAGFGN